MMFKELKEKKEQLSSQRFCKEDKKTKKYENIVRGGGGGGGELSADFRVSGDF